MPLLKLSGICWTIVFAITLKAEASQESIGPKGIESLGLQGANGQSLDGTGIAIGQVELSRPGKPVSAGGTDDAAHSNTTIKPTAVFTRDVAAAANDNVKADEGMTGFAAHAEQVAGVMISIDATITGVSTKAKLYAAQFNPPKADDDDVVAYSAEHLINYASTHDSNSIRAMNFSFVVTYDGGQLDGNQKLTEFVDWSANHDDVVYIVAGREKTLAATVSVPTDNFNGITVGSSAIGGIGDVYREVASGITGNDYSEPLVGSRTAVSLIAPGEGIELTGLNGSTTIQSGTSLAVPHVTGTVALLQQYGKQRIDAGAARWNGDAQHHQVMKAVLMNSADKLIDNGTIVVNGNVVPVGSLLGMDRTVVDQNGHNWLDSPAYGDEVGGAGETIPLDPQFGTGELNAKRALQQYKPGEYHAAGGQVPVIGWDYGHSTHANQVNAYAFNQQLLAGSFISITLAFDRIVQLDQDGGTPGVFDSGDAFVPSNYTVVPGHDQFSDLDLYLLPKGSLSINDAIANSISGDGTVDHIFFQIPTTGEYEFWVQQFNANAGPVDYGVAWWAKGTGPITATVGDFNFDGVFDSTDLDEMFIALTNKQAYENQFDIADEATLTAIGDINHDGVFGNRDIQAMLDGLINGTLGTPKLAAVPEPATWLLLALSMQALIFKRGKRSARKMLCTSRTSWTTY